jgi:hypothetical protein
MDKIKEYISNKRNTLSDSSVNTYASILKNLYKRVFENTEYDLDLFDSEYKRVLEFLKDMPPNRRKTILSALVIITNRKEYREVMMEDVKDYNKQIDKQEMTETQKENWIQGGEITSMYDTLRRDAELLFKKKNLSPADLQQIQQYVILSLLGGIYIAPRRSKDYTDFRIKNVNKEKDNYIEKNNLVFNSYKTAKTYGKQQVEIPKELKTILTKWIKINPTEYLLFDINGNPLSSVKLNQRFNKMWGKKVSVNNMRHTYLTEKYAKVSEENKKLQKEMSNMGSSTAMADTYIKLK